MFLLVSKLKMTDRNQLLNVVHGQFQKSKQKHTAKDSNWFHSHSTLITISYKHITFSKPRNYSIQNRKKVHLFRFKAKYLMLNDSSMNGTCNTYYVQHTAHVQEMISVNHEKYQDKFFLYKIALNNNNT